MSRANSALLASERTARATSLPAVIVAAILFAAAALVWPQTLAHFAASRVAGVPEDGHPDARADAFVTNVLAERLKAILSAQAAATPSDNRASK